MDTIKILLVDDHQIIRSGIMANLKGQKKIKVIGEASDGEEALKKIMELEPDIVLMDIAMPRMNGIECARLIAEKYPKTRVLILSVHEHPNEVISAFKAGAKGYILKDISTEELVEAIEMVYNDETVIPASISKKILNDQIKSFGKPDSLPKKDLTQREIEILSLVAKGFTSREIAGKLFISIYTVNAHREHIMNKLGIRNIVELTRYAIDSGLTLE